MVDYPLSIKISTCSKIERHVIEYVRLKYDKFLSSNITNNNSMIPGEIE